MRLVGIDAHGQDDTVYAALFQSSLGQIGFHVDTRVYGLHCEVLPALSAWYGTAQAADLLVGSGRLHNATAESGGRWRVLQGELRRTPRGLIGHSNLDLALLEMPAPAGAVHVLISPGKLPPACALLWRSQDADNTWGLFFDNDSCQLKIRENGHWSQIALDEHRGLAGISSSAIQILDDGRTFSLYLDGTLLFDSWFTDPRFNGATRLGLLIMNRCDVSFRRLASHAREIPIPAELQMGIPWLSRSRSGRMGRKFVRNGLTNRDLTLREGVGKGLRFNVARANPSAALGRYELPVHLRFH